jgi:hypothetical protein
MERRRDSIPGRDERTVVAGLSFALHAALAAGIPMTAAAQTQELCCRDRLGIGAPNGWN